jgi:FG-GAP repeat
MKMALPAFYITLLALAAPSLAITFIKAPVFTSSEVRFKKKVLDREFRSEGVAVADVNKDGKPDVIAGNLWYEAPDWAPREIQQQLRQLRRRHQP